MTKTLCLKIFNCPRWPRKLTLKSRLGSGIVQKISNLLRFENGFEIRNLHHFVSKKAPTSFPESSGLPKYNELGQISWCSKIDNFKQGQILKIVSFTERGSLTENNGTITNVQLLMVMEKFNFFKNFKNFKNSLMGGHDEKVKNFGRSKKKSLIFTN